MVVHLDTQDNFFGLPSPVELGKEGTFLLAVFYFEAKTCQNRISVALLDGCRACYL